MCFSAEASFTASIALALISWASYRKITKSKQLLLLGVPLGFAIQQFCEGLVWLAFTRPLSPIVNYLALYGFLFFAFLFWPVYIPLILAKLERTKLARQTLKLLLGLGVLVAGILLALLLTSGASAVIANCHIIYQLGAHWPDSLLFGVIALLSYVLATVGSLLVSTLPGMRQLGLATLIAFIIAQSFYHAAAVSVWCFLAAILSLMVYRIVGAPHKLVKRKKTYF